MRTISLFCWMHSRLDTCNMFTCASVSSLSVFQKNPKTKKSFCMTIYNGEQRRSCSIAKSCETDTVIFPEIVINDDNLSALRRFFQLIYEHFAPCFHIDACLNSHCNTINKDIAALCFLLLLLDTHIVTWHKLCLIRARSEPVTPGKHAADIFWTLISLDKTCCLIK